MKYIFVVGAPGSKWSSVCKNIYYSPSVDRTDYSEARNYFYHSSVGAEYCHWTDEGQKALADYISVMGYKMLQAEEVELTPAGIKKQMIHLRETFLPVLKNIDLSKE